MTKNNNKAINNQKFRRVIKRKVRILIRIRRSRKKALMNKEGRVLKLINILCIQHQEK